MNPYIIIAVLLAIAGAGAGGYMKGGHDTKNAMLAEQRQHEVDALSDAVKEQNAEQARRKAEADRTDALLTARTRAMNEAQKENRRYEDLLVAAQKDPESRKWLATPVPCPVWRGLRERPADGSCDEDGKAVPPVQPGGGDAHPKAAQFDGLRLDFLLSRPGGGLAVVQR